MQRKWFLASGVITVLLLLSGCHQHTWVEANCITARTCESCGETEGEPLGHEWREATCTTPKTCERCGEMEGEPLGHEWREATCTTPKTCERCGETEGIPTEHDFVWRTIVEATCSAEGAQEGMCSACGETKREPIDKLPHTTDGNWVITKEAVGFAEGTRVQYCSVCGEIAEEESYELSSEEQEAYYKENCETYTYDEIARKPDDYMFKTVKFRGEVVQVIEEGNDVAMRLNITQGKYSWSDTIYVMDIRTERPEGRILEGDIITVYGLMTGTVTYKTVLGASVTIPSMLANFIDV